MVADDILDFDFPVTSVANKVILQSGDFKDILNELDPTSEFVELFLSPEAPFFQITTNGVAGECQVSFLFLSGSFIETTRLKVCVGCLLV